MKMLKIVMVLALLCLIVPTMAEDRRTDQTAYQANPGCQLKITLRTGETKFPISYRLTFHQAPTSTTGALDANSTAELLLPVSHQWYDLFVERDEVDKALYTIETGCTTSPNGTMAPAPVMTEERWSAAQQMLLTFVQHSQGSITAQAPSTNTPVGCTISTRSGNIRMRAGHSTTAAVVGTLPRNVELQVIERFAETVGRQTRVWYRLVKEVVAPTSDAEAVWVGGAVKTAGDCVTPASATTIGSATGASSVLPQTGSWTLTYGPTVYVTCNNAGSADFSTNDALNHLTFESAIASEGSGFTLNGVAYTQDANSTWHGYYTESSIQAVGEALIRVDTPTRILGDFVISSGTISDCTFKFPFWAAPR